MWSQNHWVVNRCVILLSFTFCHCWVQPSLLRRQRKDKRQCFLVFLRHWSQRPTTGSDMQVWKGTACQQQMEKHYNSHKQFYIVNHLLKPSCCFVWCSLLCKQNWFSFMSDQLPIQTSICFSCYTNTYWTEGSESKTRIFGQLHFTAFCMLKYWSNGFLPGNLPLWILATYFVFI